MNDVSAPLTTCVFVILLDGDLVQTPEHLGVASLLAILRQQGVECRVVAVRPGEEQAAIDRICALAPRFIAISLTTVNLPRAARVGGDLRARMGSGTHFCAGGPIATFLGDRLLTLSEWSFLDSLVRGEGEEVIGPLVARVLAGESLEGLRGVTAPGIPATFPLVVAVDDLDSLPWPARDQLEERLAEGGRFPYVRLSTSRGCTSRCTFCNAPHAGNNLAKRKGWRGRDPEDVVDEIANLKDRYGVDTFDFVDSTFEDPGGRAMGKARVRRLAELILERDLKIYYNICSQAKNWHDEDRELLDLLFRSGLEKVLIGIESGSDRVLQLFKKSSTVEDNHRALRLFREQGVYVAFGFLMFHPYAAWRDLEENGHFLLEQMGHNLRRFITRLELYPGAEIVHQLEADGLLDPTYWQTLNPYAYRYQDPDIARLAQMLNELFGAGYLRQGTIEEEPSVFAFETFDITLHTYLSRLQRDHHDHPEARRVIEDHVAAIEHEKKELAKFNGELFFDLVSRSRAGVASPTAEIAAEVEDRYRRSIEALRSIQMRLGMNLRRSRSAILPAQRVAYA